MVIRGLPGMGETVATAVMVRQRFRFMTGPCFESGVEALQAALVGPVGPVVRVGTG